MPNVVKGSILDLVTGESLTFAYNPGTISDERSPQYADQSVVGYSHPASQFVNGGARTVSFTLRFHLDNQGVEAVRNRCEWLRSLTYPDHDANGRLRTAPHLVALLVGSLYREQSWEVRSVRVTYKDLFDPQTVLPLLAEVSLTLQEFVEGSVNYSTIRRGAGSSDAGPTLGAWSAGESVREVATA